MSSTERAPEPTMEEILASIRRIISDDESSLARQRTSPQSQPDEEGVEGEADDEIINDIARVLSNSGGNAASAAPASAAPVTGVAEEEEDILDLTAELGGLELVDDFEEIEMVEVVAEAAPDIHQPGRPVEAPEPEPELELVDEAPPEAVAAEASAPEFAAQPAAVAPPPRMSASEEAASALERAIAALRAGQVPTSSTPFSFQSQAEPFPVTEPAPPLALAPSYEPMPLADPAPVPAAEPEPTLPEPEAEFVLTEFEIEMVEAEPVVEVLASEPRADQAWGMSAPPSWSTQPEFEAEEEPEPRVNGGGMAHQPYVTESGSIPKSLEDSVKDMLRPMLRQWLEENMSRVLTAALKEELKGNPSHLQGD